MLMVLSGVSKVVILMSLFQAYGLDNLMEVELNTLLFVLMELLMQLILVVMFSNLMVLIHGINFLVEQSLILVVVLMVLFGLQPLLIIPTNIKLMKVDLLNKLVYLRELMLDLMEAVGL